MYSLHHSCRKQMCLRNCGQRVINNLRSLGLLCNLSLVQEEVLCTCLEFHPLVLLCQHIRWLLRLLKWERTQNCSCKWLGSSILYLSTHILLELRHRKTFPITLHSVSILMHHHQIYLHHTLHKCYLQLQANLNLYRKLHLTVLVDLPCRGDRRKLSLKPLHLE